MELRISNDRLEHLKCDLLVLPVSESDLGGKSGKNRVKNKGKKRKPHLEFSDVDEALNGSLSKKLKQTEFKPDGFANVLLNVPGDSRFEALLLVGWNRNGSDRFEEGNQYRKLGQIIYDAAKKLHLTKVSLGSSGLSLQGENNVRALIEGLELSSYSFQKYKSKEEKKFSGIKTFTILGSARLGERVTKQAIEVSGATALARDLVNTPPGDCTPSFLVETARAVARKGKLAIKVYDRAVLEKMGARLLLAVSAGSSQPPYLIKLTYKPKKRSKVIAIVGKGITFDSGGLSIKTASGMETMKMDMAGAAAAIATMQAVAALKPNVEVRAYIPTCENMINGDATKPGDIVAGLSGKTVEILNTDAEGRLILADALAIAEREKTNVIIDLATLTGACVVALGNDYAGLFSTDENLVSKLMDASVSAGERLWRMPLAKEYKELIKSSVADIKNTGGGWGGAITGALFLNEFVSKTPWAHLDIAGPAFSDSDKGYIKKGGVGFGVRTLVEYLMKV